MPSFGCSWNGDRHTALTWYYVSASKSIWRYLGQILENNGNMKELDKIAHIISRDKFTSGYINFMKLKFPMYDHYFLVRDAGFPLDLVDEKNVIFYHPLHARFYRPAYAHWEDGRKILSLLDDMKLIVISGFGIQGDVLRWPQRLWDKTYIQFWGGDFYGFRGAHFWSRGRIKTKLCLRRCKAYIYLVDGEYEKMMKIFAVPKQYFIAPVPADPQKKIDLSKYFTRTSDGIVRIIVGNSATKENQHKEAYNVLARFRDEAIEVYSPLSYGDEQYRDKVIQYGRLLFGDKYHPIVDFMQFEGYMDFLSHMDAGIFNNNRQQALGNIYLLLGMGKRVYVRQDVSMWKSLHSDGYRLSSFDSLHTIPFDKLDVISNEDRENNFAVFRAWDSKGILQWKKVFDSVK